MRVIPWVERRCRQCHRELGGRGLADNDGPASSERIDMRGIELCEIVSKESAVDAGRISLDVKAVLDADRESVQARQRGSGSPTMCRGRTPGLTSKQTVSHW